MKKIIFGFAMMSSISVQAENCKKQLENVGNRLAVNKMVQTSLFGVIHDNLFPKVQDDEVKHSELYHSSEIVTDVLENRRLKLEEERLKLLKLCP